MDRINATIKCENRFKVSPRKNRKIISLLCTMHMNGTSTLNQIGLFLLCVDTLGSSIWFVRSLCSYEYLKFGVLAII